MQAKFGPLYLAENENKTLLRPNLNIDVIR